MFDGTIDIIAGTLLRNCVYSGSICSETHPVLLFLLNLDSLLDCGSNSTRDSLLLIISWSRYTPILLVLSCGWIVFVGLSCR